MSRIRRQVVDAWITTLDTGQTSALVTVRDLDGVKRSIKGGPFASAWEAAGWIQMQEPR